MRKQIAKRSGLAAALDRGRLEDPEPEETGTVAASSPAQTPAKEKKATRFHTSFYPASRQLYDNVKIALIREGEGRDFNALVNDLLTEWLEANGER